MILKALFLCGMLLHFTVWKLRKFTRTLFRQKLRETKVTKELVSRNIFSVGVNFTFFHTVHLMRAA